MAYKYRRTILTRAQAIEANRILVFGGRLCLAAAPVVRGVINRVSDMDFHPITTNCDNRKAPNLAMMIMIKNNPACTCDSGRNLRILKRKYSAPFLASIVHDV